MAGALFFTLLVFSIPAEHGGRCRTL